MTLVPAATLDLAQLAALFTASYEGYYVPVEVDAAALGSMIDAWDIDLARSRVALDEGGEPVGFANLGVRGDTAWIGGIGVVPRARRRGLGRSLMEAVVAEAPGTVTLEVLEQNEPATRLYEELGFVRTRVLEVWTLAADVPPADARSVEPRPLGQQGLPWQRADESIPADGVERIEVEGGAALIRVNGPRVGIVQLEAQDEGAAASLLAAARGRGESLHYVNLPAGEPASAALQRLGGTLDLRQFEYELRR